MKKWTTQDLERMEGRHVHSELDCRIQVLSVSATEVRPWQIPKGSVLAIVLRGTCLAVCNGVETDLQAGDQVLLARGESFGFRIQPEESPATVQMVWMPGIEEEDEQAQSNSQRPIRRELGQLRGKIWFADDFDGPLPEDIQRHFEGAGD